MTDLLSLTQDALFAALNVAAVTDEAPVFQHVPDETEPPMVVIGRMARTPAGGKDGGLDLIDVAIITIYRAPDRSPLLRLMAAVRTALESTGLAAIGADFSFARETSAEDDLAEDGETYFGTQHFELFVQAA